MSLDIIMPVYNEGENIEKNLDLLNVASTRIQHRITVAIVYDFEEDNTLPVIERIRDKYSFAINLIKNESKGVCSAIKKGIGEGRSRFFLVSMADMSDDYSILPEMVKEAEDGSDIVCGSRHMKGGKMVGGPILKRLLSRIAGLSIHWLSGIPTHDVTNSYKLYNRNILSGIKIESVGGFEIGFEITAKAYQLGFAIIEIPTIWWDRTIGKSKFKLLKWLPCYMKWYLFLLFHKKEKKRV